MKNILAGLALFALAAVSAQAQGLVSFTTGAAAGARISTNSIIGGPATGVTGTNGVKYYFGLYYSPTATSVNGQTGAISGASSVNYAFNDSNWTLVAYGTNTTQGGRLLVSSCTNPVVIPGVAGGSSAQFVLIGWSANIGTNIAAVQNWFGLGDPTTVGYIGQSAVSGALILGGGLITTPVVFGNYAPELQGFTLGQAGYSQQNIPPIVTSQPINVTVLAGANASFSVAANGYPAPTYQWMFNGTNVISGATGSTLNLTSVQSTDAGNYSVVITNSAGSTNSASAVLTVVSATAPPYITRQPANMTLQAGSNATFTVSAMSASPLTYQWYAGVSVIANATNTSLTLVGVQTNDAGNYLVAVSNLNGTTNSAAAVLSVQGAPPVIHAQPSSITVVSGATATFTVSADGSTPLSYQWSFNNTNLAGATSASLTLIGVSSANVGSYAVTITNAYGSTNSASATLSLSASQNAGYVLFGNNNNSATKIFTNSAVGGAMTGLTSTNGGPYRFALFASATATSVNNQTSSITGAASVNYAFNDANWTLVAYGTNIGIRGRFVSEDADGTGFTPIQGFPGGTYAQFVVIGWSANVGTDIPAVATWFNGGSPSSDGWIGQSAVSGPIMPGDGGAIPPGLVFGTFPPNLHGFTLGLVSPDTFASYVVPYSPPAILQTKLSGGSVKLSWSNAAGTFGVQYATGPVGPWTDLSATVTSDGTTSSVNVPSGKGPFYRLITQ